MNYGKIFIKNMVITGISLAMLFILILAFFIPIANERQNTQISKIEYSEISKSTISITNMMNQVANVCAYFATNDLLIGSDDYYAYNLFINQVNLIKVFVNGVENVYVKSRDRVFAINEIYDIDKVMSGDNYCGTLNNTKVFGLGQSNSILFCKTFSDNSYDQQNVFISFNKIEFSKNIFADDESGIELVLDSNGYVVLSSEKGKYVGKNFSEICDTKIDFKNNPEKNVFESEKKKYIVSSCKFDNLELYSVRITDLAQYEDYIKKGAMQNIIIITICMVIIIFLIFAISVVTYMPINKLVKQVNSYSILPTLYSHREDEVNYISNQFDKLYNDNNQLDRLLNDKIKMLHHQQMIAMQMQICPHFIYNTLNHINCLALDITGDFENSISKIISSMSKIIDKSLQIDNCLSTVSEELDLTKQYVKILKQRFDNKFDVVWDIDEETLNGVILKICLQPLIENCATHAFINLFEGAQIRISIKKKEDRVCVEVSDNGIGMTKERLQDIKEHIKDFTTTPLYHIGIHNVNYRLFLLYGENSSLEIESDLGKGTICKFSVPYTEKGQNDNI